MHQCITTLLLNTRRPPAPLNCSATPGWTLSSRRSVFPAPRQLPARQSCSAQPQGGLCLPGDALPEPPGNLRHPNLAPRPQGALCPPGEALPQPPSNLQKPLSCSATPEATSCDPRVDFVFPDGFFSAPRPSPCAQVRFFSTR
jgi:hypothetical protein